MEFLVCNCKADLHSSTLFISTQLPLHMRVLSPFSACVHFDHPMHGASSGVLRSPSLSPCRAIASGFTTRTLSGNKPSARRYTRRAVISDWQVASTALDEVVRQTQRLTAGEIPMLAGVLDKGEQHALLLSTLAGLSTSIGGAIAIVKKPGNDLLSFLLGIAIGVMATLSILEMWLHNAVEHGPIAITAATAVGVALYYIAQPYFPDFETHQAGVSQNHENFST